MSKRILICRSNPIAPDPRVEKTAQALATAGYHVTILGWDRSTTLPKQDTVAGISCFRLPIRAEFGQGIHNFPGLVRWQFGLLGWLFKHRRQYDILHACDFDTVIPALLVKFLWRKKVVYDIFDFYADHLRATPQWIKNILRQVDLWIIGQVDAIIIVDQARYQQIKPARYKRSTVIYNTPEDIYIQEKDKSSSGFSIAYTGLLQVERGILELLQVLQNHPEWTLDLAGFGGDLQIIQNKFKNLKNVNFFGRIPYEQALELSRQANVLLATYDPQIENHKYASPNKIFEAMMLGKPVIVARNTNMDLIVNQFDCGLVIDYGDIAALEESLVKLANDSELQNQLGKNARLAYETHFSWSVMQSRLLALYQEITSP